MNHDEKIASEFGVTPAESVVLMTVGYEVPLPKNQFVPHAVWEAMNEVTENQVSEAFDDCLSKGWITLTEYDYPEFTIEGKRLWARVRSAIVKWSEEERVSFEEQKRQEDANQEAKQLGEWHKWSQDRIEKRRPDDPTSSL